MLILRIDAPDAECSVQALRSALTRYLTAGPLPDDIATVVQALGVQAVVDGVVSRELLRALAADAQVMAGGHAANPELAPGPVPGTHPIN